jgi:hypothetical protein
MCGSPVHVHTGDEGTSSYVPDAVNELALSIARHGNLDERAEEELAALVQVVREQAQIIKKLERAAEKQL